jgi:hypothetical protein
MGCGCHWGTTNNRSSRGDQVGPLFWSHLLRFTKMSSDERGGKPGQAAKWWDIRPEVQTKLVAISA